MNEDFNEWNRKMIKSFKHDVTIFVIMCPIGLFILIWCLSKIL